VEREAFPQWFLHDVRILERGVASRHRDATLDGRREGEREGGRE
jgi:hypothetical protein